MVFRRNGDADGSGDERHRRIAGQRMSDKIQRLLRIKHLFERFSHHLRMTG